MTSCWGDKELFILCDCGHYDHTIVFSYWPLDEDQYMYIHLHMVERPILSRIWNGIRYILKGDMDLGHWHEVLLNPKDIGKLEAFVLEARHDHRQDNATHTGQTKKD